MRGDLRRLVLTEDLGTKGITREGGRMCTCVLVEKFSKMDFGKRKALKESEIREVLASASKGGSICTKLPKMPRIKTSPSLHGDDARTRQRNLVKAKHAPGNNMA